MRLFTCPSPSSIGINVRSGSSTVISVVDCFCNCRQCSKGLRSNCTDKPRSCRNGLLYRLKNRNSLKVRIWRLLSYIWRGSIFIRCAVTDIGNRCIHTCSVAHESASITGWGAAFAAAISITTAIAATISTTTILKVLPDLSAARVVGEAPLQDRFTQFRSDLDTGERDILSIIALHDMGCRLDLVCMRLEDTTESGGEHLVVEGLHAFSANL